MSRNDAIATAANANPAKADRSFEPRVCAALLLAFASAIATPCAEAEEGPPEPAEQEEEEASEGLVARMGSVTASFRFFGDVGVGYDSAIEEGAKANFLSGTFAFFSTVRLSDNLQALSEVVAEFDGDTNEVGFELERLWAQWSRGDALYVKMGREHGPASHWNRRYHHGRIFWPAATQPFLARFEDQGGPLPIHFTGIEIGGTHHTKAGALAYVGVLSNGRGVEPTEVTNVADHNDSKAWDVGGSFAPSALPGFVFGANYRSDEIPENPAVLQPDMDETIATVFVTLLTRHWEVIAEGARIVHEPASSAFDFRHRSAYLQIDYLRERWGPYGRVDVRRMADGDPFYIGPGLDLDRWDGLLGVRLDLADQAALKVEAGLGRAEQRTPSGAVETDDVSFAALGLQWVF